MKYIKILTSLLFTMNLAFAVEGNINCDLLTDDIDRVDCEIFVLEFDSKVRTQRMLKRSKKLDELIEELPVIGNVQPVEHDFSSCGEESNDLDEHIKYLECKSDIMDKYIDGLPDIRTLLDK